LGKVKKRMLAVPCAELGSEKHILAQSGSVTRAGGCLLCRTGQIYFSLAGAHGIVIGLNFSLLFACRGSCKGPARAGFVGATVDESATCMKSFS
jgi:hypothetical protein